MRYKLMHAPHRIPTEMGYARNTPMGICIIILIDSSQLRYFPPQFLSRCDLRRIIMNDDGELCISVSSPVCRSLGAHLNPQKHLVVRSMELEFIKSPAHGKPLVRDESGTAPTQKLIHPHLDALWCWSTQIMAVIGRKLTAT
jgi:hypothetical protein